MTFTRRTFLKSSLPLASFLCFSRYGFPNANDAPDYVFYNGNVITVDKEFRTVSAFVVSEDRIIALGSDEEMLALADSKTIKIDLQGKTVLPGIIDSHLHPVSAAMYEMHQEIPNMDTIAEVLDWFRAQTKIVPKGEWFGVQQVFLTRLKDRRLPTRAELDAAAPDHPVYMRTGPDAMLNSAGLKKYGVTKDSGNLANDGSSVVVRDATGEPTGILQNCTTIPNFLTPDLSTVSDAKQLATLKRLFSAYNSVGVTTIADRNARDVDLELFKKLRDSNELTCRIHAFHEISNKLTPDQIEEKVKAVSQSPLAEKDGFLHCGGVKMFLDGGMLTGSARMRKPWGVSKIYGITDPEYKGLFFMTPEQLTRFAQAAAKYEMQPAVHCVGDGALELLAKTYANVAKNPETKKLRDLRPGICHGNFVQPDLIPAIKESGAVIDMQPAWLYQDGAIMRDHFGSERMKDFQPYRTLLDAKIPIGGGSDHMLKIAPERGINLYSPFLGMWTMLTRMPRWSDTPLYENEQKVTREEVVRFYTIDSAFVLRAETEKGSLEPGKLADFIVLDRDIMTCSIDEVRDTKVLQCYVGGKLV